MQANAKYSSETSRINEELLNRSVARSYFTEYTEKLCETLSKYSKFSVVKLLNRID